MRFDHNGRVMWDILCETFRSRLLEGGVID
jgi:hypothetical protein